VISQNPFCDPEHPPQWAQLTRLAGDRTAILFEDFREQLGVIDGLVEELRYLGPEQGSVPACRVGKHSLCQAHILPGSLMASLKLDRPAWERALNSSRVTGRMKTILRQALDDTSAISQQVNLRTKSQIRAFTGFVSWLGRNAVD
jgi:hypothetical protein